MTVHGQKPLLTVVTVTRNAIRSGRIESLERCIRSVAAIQTPHEHLVYDGASDDGTVDCLKRWQTDVSDLKVVSEPDSGIYNALNKGVRDAGGEYFYVIGDDDYIFKPEVLDGIVSRVANGGYDMGVSPVERDNGRRFDVSPRILLWGMAYPHQGVIVRTEMIRKHGGFDERYRIAGDYDLLLRMHLDGVRHLIANESYCMFSTQGLSGLNAKAGRDEDAGILCSNLGLGGYDQRQISDRRILPLLAMLRLAWHRDYFIRVAARHQIKRWIIDKAGFLDAEGNPRRLLRRARV